MQPGQTVPLLRLIPVRTHGLVSAVSYLCERGDEFTLAIVAKRSFSMVHEGVAELMLPEPLSGQSPDAWPTSGFGECAPYLASPEVWLTGHARAVPRPAPAVSVRLAVIEDVPLVDKTVHVYGDRVAVDARPTAFSTRSLAMPPSPSGVPAVSRLGSASVPDRVGPAPLAESIGRLTAAGVRAIGDRVMVPRGMPDDLFASVPADQRAARPFAEPWVIVEGVSDRGGRVATKLPPSPLIAAIVGPGGRTEVPLRCDLCHVDADTRRVHLVYRARVPFPWDPAGRIEISSDDGAAAEESPITPAVEVETPSRPSLRNTLVPPADGGALPRVLPFAPVADPPIARRAPSTLDALRAPTLPSRIDPSQPTKESRSPKITTPGESESARTSPSAGAGATITLDLDAGESLPESPAEAPTDAGEVNAPSIDAAQTADALPTAEEQGEARAASTPFTDAKAKGDAPRPQAAPSPEDAASPAPAPSAAAAPSPADASVVATPPGGADGSPVGDAPGTAPSAVPKEVAGEAAAVSPNAASATPPAPTGIGATIAARIADKQPLSGLDLKGAEIANVDFAGADLAGVSFEASQLLDCKLVACKLDGVRFTGARLERTDLTRIEARHADFSRAKLVGCALANAVLDDAVLVMAELDGCNLDQASLAKATFSRSRIHDTTLVGVTLLDADLSEAEIVGASFDEAKMTGAKLIDARLRESTFSRATLTRATFGGAEIARCKLDGAALEQSSWERARIEGGDFGGANMRRGELGRAAFTDVALVASALEDAALAQVTFTGCDLSRAVLASADMRQAKFHRSTMKEANLSDVNAFRAAFDASDCSGAILRGATLRGARMREANLEGADLTGADLRDADCEKARFTGAKLDRAKLAGATFDGAVDAPSSGSR